MPLVIGAGLNLSLIFLHCILKVRERYCLMLNLCAIYIFSYCWTSLDTNLLAHRFSVPLMIGGIVCMVLQMFIAM